MAHVEGVGGVELRWYKHLGRGMSVNRSLQPQEWVQIFDACIASIHATESHLW
ncbi:hypothetical protein [Saccharopolyspora sp. NPDC002686]|uniref:hypothetical protein n=1 Tax=Saccharopolyspora sp. NPDC002686 TaxID=3154541 RepID=UPI00332451FB